MGWLSTSRGLFDTVAGGTPSQRKRHAQLGKTRAQRKLAKKRAEERERKAQMTLDQERAGSFDARVEGTKIRAGAKASVGTTRALAKSTKKRGLAGTLKLAGRIRRAKQSGEWTAVGVERTTAEDRIKRQQKIRRDEEAAQRKQETEFGRMSAKIKKEQQRQEAQWGKAKPTPWRDTGAILLPAPEAPKKPLYQMYDTPMNKAPKKKKKSRKNQGWGAGGWS